MIVPITTSGDTCQNKTKDQKTENGYDNRESIYIFGILMKYSDFFMVLFNGILAFFTIFLYKLSRRQSRSLENSERAYLFPEIVNPDDQRGNTFNTLDVILKNIGKTPATLKTFKIYAEIIEVPPSNKFIKRLSFIESDESIANGLPIRSEGEHGYPFIFTVDQDQWDKIIMRETNLHVKILVEYTDIFEKLIVNKFDWQYNPGNPSFFVFTKDFETDKTA